MNAENSSTIRQELVEITKLRRASTVIEVFETRETDSPISPKCQSGSQESPERKRKYSDDSKCSTLGRKRLKKDDKTAQIFEELLEKEHEARNGDLQADNEDFPTQNINPKEKLKSSSVARGELVQYYDSLVENLRQEYSAKLTKMAEMFSERKRD